MTQSVRALVSTAGTDPILDDLIEAFAKRVQTGERVDPEAYAQEHPERSAELRRILPAMLVLADLGYSAGDRASSRACSRGGSDSVLGELGDFRIVREVGRGGMGVVYEAEQISLGRRVALKVLPFAAALDGKQLQRFKNEAQAAAHLHHQNIVPVHYVGCERGVHFYAMQYIEGQTVAALIRELRRLAGLEAADAPVLEGGAGADGAAGALASELVSGQWAPSKRRDGEVVGPCSGEEPTGPHRLATPPPRHPTGASPPDVTAPVAALSTERSTKGSAFFRTVANMGVQAAEALEHAHQLGVIHRDIKPANVLVDVGGRLWITDFGLARLGGDAGLTMSGDLVGTLRYMSPEQALAKRVAVDQRTDIYSLGVTLYELLTLEPAYNGHNREEVLRQIAFEDPRPARRLNPAVPAELETIVCKAMEKNPAERYATAQEVADDLRRYLEDKPIRAKRPTLWQRTKKWARRHKPVVATALVAAAILLITLTVVASVAALWLRDERNATLEQLHKTQDAQREGGYQLYKARLAEAKARRWSGQVGQRFDSWKAVADAAQIARELELDEEHFLELRNEAIACLALADVRLAKEWQGSPPGSVPDVQFDGDLEHYARCDDQGNVSIRSVADDQELALLPGPREHTNSMRFSPNGDLLAVRHKPPSPGQAEKLQVWDWRRRLAVFEGSVATTGEPAFSPDGRRLAVGQENGTVVLYDVSTWKEVTSLKLGCQPNILDFHPDGTKLAITCGSGQFSERQEVQVRDLGTGNLVRLLSLPTRVGDLAWHPSGDLLAAAGFDCHVYLWNLATGRRHSVLRGHQGAVVGVAFAPDGSLLLSWSWDGTGRLWDVWTGRQLVQFGSGSVKGSRFSRDGRRLISQSGSRLGLWEVTSGHEYQTLLSSSGVINRPYGDGSISPDGRWLAIGGGNGVGLWDLRAGKQRAFLGLGHTQAALFHPSRPELFSSGSAGLQGWPLQAQFGALLLGPPRKLATGSFAQIAVDQEGRTLAVGGRSEGLILNPEKPLDDVRHLHHPMPAFVATSPDGRWVATGTWGGRGVKIWEAKSGKLAHDLLPHHREVTRVAFSPDGQWLVTSTVDEFAFWKVGSWQPGRQIPRAQGDGSYGEMAFAADGKIVALTVARDLVYLQEPATGQVFAKLQLPYGEPAGWMGITPDCSQLVVASTATMDKGHQGLLRVWNLRRIRAQLRDIGLDWDSPSYPPWPDTENPTTAEVRVDLGEPAPFLLTAEPQREAELLTFILALNPFNFQAYLRRGHAYACRGQLSKALDDYRLAVACMPPDNQRCAALFVARAGNDETLKNYVKTVADLQSDLEDPTEANDEAWRLVTGPQELRDPVKALALAEKAVALNPGDGYKLNTLGVVYYRLGWYEQARAMLERSLRFNDVAAFDLFFLAMCHHRLGRPDKAKECYGQAIQWWEGHSHPQWTEELKAFRTEAATLLGK